MSAICGWLGSPIDVAQRESVLKAMISASGMVPASPQKLSVAAVDGLAAIDGVGASAATDGGVHVAIAGRVLWTSPAAQELSDQRGAALAVAELYRRLGPECLRELHGVFSVGIVEPDRDVALVAIDRMGIGNLCYAHISDGLVFASSAGALVRHPRVDDALDLQAIFNYLFFHVVPAPGTIYRGVSKLLPGQLAIYRGGRLETKFYWHAQYQDHAQEPLVELKRRFRELLPIVVRRASGTDRVGTFLSGGTDSSTISGICAEAAGEPVDAYSIGFDAEGFDEMEYARVAANHFKLRHHTYYVRPDDIVQAVPLIASTYDEPFGNASTVPTYYCAKLAREDGVHTMLAGDGGDEIFGGNARYAKQKLFEAYRFIPQALRRAVVEPASGIPGLGTLSPMRKLRSYIQQARIPLPDRLESYNFLVRCDLTEILDPSFLEQIDPAQPFALMREVYERTASRDAISRMMHLDLKHTLADNDLRKVGTMCRLAGVEVRYPLLDDEMVAFSGEVPPGEKVKGLRLRHFFKEALKDFLPPEIIAKKKHGFGLPFGVWLDEHAALRDLAADSLVKFRRRGYVLPAYIDSLLSRRQKEDASYYGVMVWVIMMLEQWFAAHGRP